MAKIIYTPWDFRAVVLGAGEHLTISNDTVFNPGTANFGLDCLFKQTAASDTNNLFWKISSDWSPPSVGSGFVFYTTSAGALGFIFNDGGTAVTVASSNGLISNGTYYWARANVNRAGTLGLYLNGVLVASANISSRSAGSWSSTTTPLYICNPGTAGAITASIARVDMGRALAGDWFTQEWDRLRYGYPRSPLDYTATWLFGDSLVDLSGVYTLVYSGSTPTYATGYPSGSLSYTLPFRFDFGHELGFIDADYVQRTIDGTLFSAKGPRKRRYSLSFECSEIQKMILEAAWAGSYPIYFYEDESLPASAQVKIISTPKCQSLFVGYYSVDVEMEEV
jgi:hypothetical protein